MTHSHNILVRGDDSSTWEEPAVSAYRNEAHLQELLAADPNRVPGVVGLAQAIRELHTSAGYVDVVAVEASGAITVVECKLASNQDERRKVIGQVQDYASAIWTAGFDEFEAGWRSRGGKPFEEWLDDGGLDALRRNVSGARMHLCIAVDRIDDDLKRLVEYLNVISRDDVSVTAIQLAYAKHGPIEILVPETYGAELAEAKSRRAHPATAWTKDLLLGSLSDPDDRASVGRLLDAVEATMGEPLGEREPFWFGSYPGGGVHLHPFGLRFPPIELWVNSAGRATLRPLWNTFPSVTDHPSFGLLSQIVGYPHPGPTRGVLLSDVSLELVVDVVFRCAIEINEPAGTGAAGEEGAGR